ncbi:sensor histidine kinase [Compostimonas suwonensis]|uniref:histidine kinase n=1 Tax=Compostimonas suwonensis TaxID=1048394 RepID=A0A2M9BBF6_9MICO|nr:HAMP domain-containing sensor histidine kinase [Compostimonas suwonensis]PJJ55278.1 two-component system sensor histidine kinase VanS [Compostimonas suwonensis]
MTGRPPAATAVAASVRLPRFSARARFTIASSLLLVVIGALMLTGIYLAMRYIPTYDISPGTFTTAAPTTLTLSPTPLQAADLGTVVQTGVVISTAGDVLDTLLVVGIVSLVAIGALGAWLSWILAGRMLKPLQVLNTAAERAATGSLSHRVALAGPDDEFTRLSKTFDDMLERLERSFTAHQRFAANASHELRTPLATTKTLLDVGRDDPAAADVPQLLERLAETNGRSIEIVEAMLDLSDIGQSALRAQAVDVGGIVTSELRLVRAEASARGIRFTTSLEPAVASADSVLMRQLVANLLLNAVRHNTADGAASVSTRLEPLDPLPVVLTVSNSGDRVPPETIALLAEPFYRARGRVREVRSGPGLSGAGPSSGDTHGLGLALVASIVDAHEGRLEIAANVDGGLRVTVRLPGAVRGAGRGVDASADAGAGARSPGLIRRA